MRVRVKETLLSREFELLRFEREQSFLGRQSAAEAGEFSVCTDDAMAWNHDRDGILAIRRAYGSRRFGISHALRQLAVGDRFAVRDVLQIAPHGALKFSAFGRERQIELGAAAREIFA